MFCVTECLCLDIRVGLFHTPPTATVICAKQNVTPFPCAHAPPNYVKQLMAQLTV